MEDRIAVLFAKGPLGELSAPQLSLLSHVGRQLPLLVAGSTGGACDPALPEARAVPLPELMRLDWDRATAIVLHPCWAPIAVPLSPRRLIAMPDGPDGDEEPKEWQKFRSLLCAYATVVVADAEPFYLEQSFRRDNVFLLDGGDRVSDHFALLAADWTVGGFDPAPLVRLQRRYRAGDAEERLLGSERKPEAVFFHAVYRYLLGDPPYARKELLASFEQAALEGHPQALTLFYRFQSAILAEEGKLEEALLVYGHAALSDEERRQARTIERYLREGRIALAKAQLYAVNDDYRQAIALLEELREDPDARTLLIDACIQTGRLERALALIDFAKLRKPGERREYRLLQGTSLLLAGKRHEAVHAFLEAAADRFEALGNVIEIAVLDEWAVKFAEQGG